ADDLRRLLDHLGIKQAVVCGLSMGGYVALAFYRKYTARVRALVLASTRAGPDTAEARVGREQMATRLRAEGARAASESMLPKLISPETRRSRPELVDFLKEMIQSNAPEGMARAAEAMAIRPSSEELLRSIEIPVLIMHGTEDEVVPRGDAQMLARGIRGAKLQLLPDTGHLTNLEQPDSFNRFLNEFLLDLPPSVGSLKFA
ncbi:MAG TPA: alpha/beta fold hydrolase, partial [Longimicrobiales bacterium]|nr:alpha/beta fold hydrolase [Longimicrobiales bacterium]